MCEGEGKGAGLTCVHCPVWRRGTCSQRLLRATSVSSPPDYHSVGHTGCERAVRR